MNALTYLINIAFLSTIAVIAFSWLLSCVEKKGTPEIDKASNYFYSLSLVPFALFLLFVFLKVVLFIFT